MVWIEAAQLKDCPLPAPRNLARINNLPGVGCSVYPQYKRMGSAVFVLCVAVSPLYEGKKVCTSSTAIESNAMQSKLRHNLVSFLLS